MALVAGIVGWNTSESKTPPTRPLSRSATISVQHDGTAASVFVNCLLARSDAVLDSERTLTVPLRRLAASDVVTVVIRAGRVPGNFSVFWKAGRSPNRLMVG